LLAFWASDTNPATTEGLDIDTDLVFQLANPCTCAICLKVFSSTTGLTQHVASPVHATPMYRPRDFFLEIEIKLDPNERHQEREFETLSALVQQVDLGTCKGGNKGWKKAVTFLEEELANLGFGGLRLLGN
jgi:hypothetical protein